MRLVGSYLTVRVFPRIRLRASGSTSVGSSPLGPGGLVTVLSLVYRWAVHWRFILFSDVFVREVAFM